MPSFLDLNNRGIRHLDNGDYEKAAELFRESFNDLKQVIERRAAANTSQAGSSKTAKARDPSSRTKGTQQQQQQHVDEESNCPERIELEDVGSITGSLPNLDEETTTTTTNTSGSRQRRRRTRAQLRRTTTTSTGSSAPATRRSTRSSSSTSAMGDNDARRITYSAQSGAVNETTSPSYSNHLRRSKRKQRSSSNSDGDDDDAKEQQQQTTTTRRRNMRTSTENNNSSGIRKRQKITAAGGFASIAPMFDNDGVESKTEKQVGPLGRPLWLQAPKKKGGNTLCILASSILYNFAYALHRMGTKVDMTADDNDADDQSSSPKKKRRYLQQALNIYGVAMRVSVKGRSHVVLWLCCHNLQHLLVHCFDRTSGSDASRYIQKYRKLETHKANILRSLGGGGRTTGNGPLSATNHTCLMVLAMLGLGGSENPDSPAAAA